MVKNPFKYKQNYYSGLILSAIFISLLVVNYVTDVVTNQVIDKFQAGCYVTFADRPTNLERCVQKTDEARSLEVLDKSICADQLSLEADDLRYCEAQFDANDTLVKIRATLKFAIGWIANISFNMRILIVMGLFVVGFFGNWIRRS